MDHSYQGLHQTESSTARWCPATTTDCSDQDHNRGFWTELEKDVEHNSNSEKKDQIYWPKGDWRNPESMAPRHPFSSVVKLPSMFTDQPASGQPSKTMRVTRYRSPVTRARRQKGTRKLVIGNTRLSKDIVDVL